MNEVRFKLNPEGIAICTKAISGLPDEYFKNYKAKTSLTLLLETCLEQYKEKFKGAKPNDDCDEQDCVLSFAQSRGSLGITLRIPGECFNPLDKDSEGDEFYTAISRNVRKFLLNEPSYNYERGINILSVEQKRQKKRGVLYRELIVLAASVLFTMVGMLLPEGFRTSLLPSIDILGNTIINIVKTGASLAMFLMIIDGIRSCGNLSNIKSYGKRIIDLSCIKFLVGLAAIFAFIFFTDLEVKTGPELQGENFLTTIFTTLSGIFPTSLVEPFADINFLHIIVLGAVIGFAILIAGERVNNIGKLCEEGQIVAGKILFWCSSLLPIYVFCQIPSFVWGGKQEQFKEALSMLIIILAIYLVMYSLYLAWMSVELKVSVASLLNKISPAFYRGFMTRSSAASFAEIQDTVENFGVEKSFSDFASPISFVFCRSYHFVTIFILVTFLFNESGMDMSAGLLLGVILSSLFISIASPPIPGGTIITVSVLASTFGIDKSFVALVVPIVLITNYIISGLRSADIAMHTIHAAHRCGKIQEIE